ncbi:hypothetical protein D9M71_443360 [compost metagenome]
MHVQRRPVPEFARLPRQQAQVDVDAGGRRVQRRVEQPVAAVDQLHRQPFAGQVQCHPLPGMGLMRFAVLRVQAAHPHAAGGGAEQQLVVDRHLAGQRCTGDHHAGARHTEGAVDGQTEIPVAGPRRHRAGLLAQRSAQGVDSRATDTGDGEQRRIGKGAGGQQTGHLGLDLGQARRLDPVDLGQCHQRMGNAQQFDDGQVLAGLRHHPVVGGYHQQHAVDAAGTG